METQIDSRVPEQFRNAILAREKEAVVAGQPPATVPPAVDPSQVPVVAGAEPPAAEGAVPVVSGQEGAKPAVPAEGEPAAGAAPAAGAEPTDPLVSDPAWDPKLLVTPEMSKEHRYKVIAGMQRKDSRAAREAIERVATLERENQELRTSRPAAAPVAAAAPPAGSSGAEKAERMRVLQEKLAGGAGDYHKDIVELIELMGFVKSSDLEPVRQQVEKVSGEVGKVAKAAQASAQDSFLSDLASLAPDWEAKNITPGFKVFLKTRVPGTLFTYEDAALKANAEGDPNALADVFNLYDSGAPAAPVTPPRKPPSKLASPARTSAAAPAPKPEPAVVTVKESDYLKFTADVQSGKYQSQDPVKHTELQTKLSSEKTRFQQARAEGRMVFNPA